MRYELLGHRVRVYAVSIVLLGVLVSAAVWLRGTPTEPMASTTLNVSAGAVVLMVEDSPQGTGR
jgi:hypothetical protein